MSPSTLACMRALVHEYTSSSSEVEEEPAPLPHAASWFQEGVGAPDPHEGRIRSFPHEEGAFATHVYVQVSAGVGLVQKVQSARLQLLRSFPHLHEIEEWHVSCSRTVAVRAPQIESLRRSLSHALRRTRTIAYGFGRWNVFVNDEKTRTFVAMEVGIGATSFLGVIRAVDASFVRHGLEPYYVDPVPHVSLFWCLGDVSETLRPIVDALPRLDGGEGASHVADAVLCKVGNRRFEVALRA